MPWESYGKRPAPDSEAFEPLPGLPGLPAWLWRKLGLRGRVALGLALVVAAGAIVASVPGIRSGKRADARHAAQAERAARARIAADQRPHTAPLRARRAIAGQLEAAILRDARHRQLPVTEVSCTASGRAAFRCEAATPSFVYPYEAVADARAGVLTWCKRDPPSISDQATDVPLSPRCRAL